MNLLLIIGGVFGAIVGLLLIREARMNKRIRKLIKKKDDNAKKMENVLDSIGVAKNAPIPNNDIQSVRGWLDEVQYKHHG